MSNIGIVLSGGGAKGAYHIGVLEALKELGLTSQIKAISGASIGALNAGVLVSAPNLDEGIKRLNDLWHELGTKSPLQLSPKINVELGLKQYLTLLTSVGLHFTPAGWIKWVKYLSYLQNASKSYALFESINIEAIASDRPLKEKMDKFFDIEQLQHSIPLYVSVYEQENDESLLDIFKDIAAAYFLGKENKYSTFKHIQSLDKSIQKDILLASAAIPMLFESRHDENGKKLVDGGIGGFRKAQGNTPITPLLQNESCDTIIVTHIENGSLWDRNDFNSKIIEIRPNAKLDLGMLAILDFNADKIKSLISAGYEDTKQQLGRILEFNTALQEKRHSMETIRAINSRKLSTELSIGNNSLEDAIKAFNDV